MADRSRREKQSKLDKLAEYKRARAGGQRVLKEEDVEIYDSVSEDQYKKIVRGRLQDGDFVIEDGAHGYTDNGQEDWLDEPAESEEEEQEKSRKSKKKKAAVKPKPKPMPAPPPTSMSAYRPTISADKEADFMSSLLGDFETKVTETVPKRPSRKRKPSPPEDSDHEPAPRRSNYASYRRRSSPPVDLSSDPPMDDFPVDPPSDDTFASPHKRLKVDDSENNVTPAAERLANIEIYSSDTSFDDIDMNDFMSVDDDFDDIKPVKKEEKVPTIQLASPKKEQPELKGKWLSVMDNLAVERNEDSLGSLASNAASTSTNVSALEPDGSLRFFWLDYIEVDGKLHFTGKLKDKTSGQWVSCCVTVDNLERNLFVLPRDKQVEQDDDGAFVDTDIIPSQDDIMDDFETIRQHFGVKAWRGKFVKRNYAFGDSEVPRGEKEWMKVVYKFSEKPIAPTACSANIGKIFGTGTTAFELLVLKRKIMGPCWIQIKEPVLENKGISWCKLEVTVPNPKDFNPFPDTDPNAPKDIPPLNIVSLSIRTIVNHQANEREIVCATARTWHNMLIEDPTPPEKQKATVHTFVRPLDGFPTHFEKKAKSDPNGPIMPMLNERMLLNSLLMALYKADPDVIVGHDFLGVSLDVLLNRMRELKAEHWSRLGRFRRAKWPTIGRQGTNLKFLNGRLLCDLTSDGAKSMIASTTWSLTEMCKTHLNLERKDLDPDDTAGMMDGSVSDPQTMINFVRHCEIDAHFQMAIAAKVQILPLTKQLTALAGNAWNKTLNGGRAERNEYILLHEFHKLKYVCPDKTYGKQVKEVVDEDKEGGKTKGKKDKYKGGLVFEPKRGLWDKFILVMDFNSLYPSIIQEYNIDFTTVEKVDDDENGDERIPEPPPSETPQGVLPRIIATLVKRRRQVKGLMKDRGATEAQLLQWDIKQQALKLTANSMYGCLGFEFSRFYARPLAALTTFKGREILTHTRELAEKLNLDVVYGDTDSVFVNSNVTDLAEALRISALLKKAVNDQYNKLEIDLDSVFQRLLLLQKKKYAALKVEDGMNTKMEVKGLDMKRREFCPLSKTVSEYVLHQVLSGEATENVVENIHEYLTTMAEQIRTGQVKLEEFIISKRLGKNPEDYPDAKSQPHVQVALRMKQRGGSARAGDVISYVFCLPDGPSGPSSSQAERAKHPDEVRKGGAEVQLDYTYYLSHQILPPIERLCDPIEGTDRSRLAECLGLDVTRYRTITTGEESSGPAFLGLDSQMSDTERFKDASPFLVRCRHCQTQLPFLPLSDADDKTRILSVNGLVCPICAKTFSQGSLQMQLETQIREHIGRYYEGRTICDDPTCANKTRMMNVYGKTCLKAGCRGQVSFEYSDTQLYNQLRYYVFLFDVDKAVKNAPSGDQTGKFEIIAGRNRPLMSALTEVVEKHLAKCGRRWVELSSIFSALKV